MPRVRVGPGRRPRRLAGRDFVRMPNLAALCAVILPVSLGLGLVHLVSVGRLDAYMGLAVALVIALIMGAAVASSRRD
jgi:hypothetical protein